MFAASWPEAITPSKPDSNAARARCRTSSAGVMLGPCCCRSSAVRFGQDESRQWLQLAVAAPRYGAFNVCGSWPWTSEARQFVAFATARSTVWPISRSFMSRKTRSSPGVDRVRDRGRRQTKAQAQPCRTTPCRQLRDHAARFLCGRHIEGDDQGGLGGDLGHEGVVARLVTYPCSTWAARARFWISALNCSCGVLASGVRARRKLRRRAARRTGRAVPAHPCQARAPCAPC